MFHIGQFQKISISYHGRGSLNWKYEGMGGYLRLEFRRNGGLLNREFPQGTDECIPQKHLFYGLNQFANKAQTDDTADDLGNRIQDKHPSISNTFVLFVGENQQNVACTSSSRGPNATKHPFFSGYFLETHFLQLVLLA